MERYQLFIGGEWVDPASGEWFESTEPYSGKAWAEIPRGNAEDATRAIEAAHKAFVAPEWRGLNATQRGALLRKLAQLIEANVDLLGTVEQRDNGKLMAEVSGQVKN
ncbi:MAG: aldehyde dehydrogenase family protein, partial [Sphingomonadaceae bacterium]|nr:aldehyde dehydrogenase family protein [Sphingomonadaceae bacterium]